MSFTFKIKWKDEIRRIPLDAPPNYQQLTEILFHLFSDLPKAFSVKYTDPQNNLIPITSDKDLLDALHDSLQRENKIFLTVFGTSFWKRLSTSTDFAIRQ